MATSGAFSELRQAVAEANRALARSGLVVMSFGNASAVDRASGVFAIKPSGLACESITLDDVVVISLTEGETVGGDRRPSSDTPTHRVLYNTFPTIGGIVHTHSTVATSWAQAGRPIPCFGTTHADHFRGEVPVTRSLSVEEIGGEYELNTGLVIAEYFEMNQLDPIATPGALVASHGPFVWGEDAASAVRNAEAVELIAVLAMSTLALNPDAQPIADALIERHFSRKHGPDAYYGQQ
jgi:L-ribulose-5-phosphate 4-epimerase